MIPFVLTHSQLGGPCVVVSFFFFFFFFIWLKRVVSPVGFNGILSLLEMLTRFFRGLKQHQFGICMRVLFVGFCFPLVALFFFGSPLRKREHGEGVTVRIGSCCVVLCFCFLF